MQPLSLNHYMSDSAFAHKSRDKRVDDIVKEWSGGVAEVRDINRKKYLAMYESPTGIHMGNKSLSSLRQQKIRRSSMQNKSFS